MPVFECLITLLLSATAVFGQEVEPDSGLQLFQAVNQALELEQANDPIAGYTPPERPVDDYLDSIDRIEADYGPYATELSDLYLGLGQSFLDSGDFEKALDALHRSVMVKRVNSGPNSPGQTDHLYMIANISMLLGELQMAEEVLENIQFINARYYGEESPEMLPVLERMYDWYTLTHPPGADHVKYDEYARGVDMAEDILRVSLATNGLNYPDTALAYRRLGEAHFQTMEHVKDANPLVDVNSGELIVWDGGNKSGVDHYEEGRKAFSKYRKIVLENESVDALEKAKALADIGDWFLVLGKDRHARNNYTEAYELLAQDGEDKELAESYLGEPKPVYFFRPDPLYTEDETEITQDVSLDVSMTVTTVGNTHSVEVLNAPEDLSEETLREIISQIEEATFRPAVKDGRVVKTKDFIWRFEILAAESPS